MKTTIARTLAPAALAAAALVAPAQPAFAAPAVPGPVDPKPIEAVCSGNPDFEVTLTPTGKGGFISLPGGRFITTSPDLRVTVTGPTGKSVTYVATGANRIESASDDGLFITATGRNVITVPEVNGHDAGVYVTSGTVSWTLNSDFSERGGMFTGSGQATNICPLVAP